MTEILDRIFHYALVVPGSLLHPNFVSTNWKREYKEPYHWITPGPDFSSGFAYLFSFGTAQFDDHLAALKRRILHDKKGPYTELSRVLRPKIDATLLRTSKYFHAIGSEMLYGQNILTFCFGSWEMRYSPPSFLGHCQYRPDPTRPTMDNELEDNEYVIKKAIRQIRSRAPLKALPG